MKIFIYTGGAKGNIFVSESQASGPRFVTLKECEFCVEAPRMAEKRTGIILPVMWTFTRHWHLKAGRRFAVNQTPSASPSALQTYLKTDSHEQLAQHVLHGTHFGKHQSSLTRLALQGYAATPSLPVDLNQAEKSVFTASQ